jgi:uncharacterized membrane protein
MAELVVLGFKDMTTADQVVPELQAMQSEGIMQLADWARVIRRPDSKIEVRQAQSTTGAGAAAGALFGGLIGLLFLMPLAGAAVGAATGAIMGHFADYGISDKFIKDVGNQMTPGSSALFLYVAQMTEDKATERLSKYQPTLLRTSLSEEAETRMRSEVETQSQSQSQAQTTA